MNQIDKNIAYNLKRIRKSRNLSLDMLAEKTGVSKSMLGQIERGESNPTVATVSKIMEGIKVPFEDLIYKREERVVAVEKQNYTLYKEKEGAFKSQVIFPYSRERSFELFYLELEPESRYPANLCAENTWAYMIAQKGSFFVTVEEEEYSVEEGDSIRVPAFKECALKNPGKEQVRLYLILSHAEGAL